MQHLDQGTIHAWLDGALNADDARRIEAHLAECASCASAVAEARGLIAASSRILSALDVVPSDVIPKAPVGPTHPSAGSTRRTRNRWLPRAARIAAVVACVAVGATITARVFGVRTTPPPRDIHAGAGDRRAATTAAAVVGASSAPAPSTKAVAAAPTPRPQPTTKAAGPAREQARSLEHARTMSQPKPATSVAADASTQRVAAASDTVRAAPDTLPRLISSDRVVTVIGSVVQRRIYEVRPGVRVTLEEVAAPRANYAEPQGVRRTARESPPVAAPAIEFPPKPSTAAAFGYRAPAADSVILHSIQWTDSTGTRFTLSGPLPVEELRRLRAVVH